MAKPSVGGYQKQNLSVLLKGMQMHVKGVIAQQLIAVLTGNLHDATGIGVYADGVVMAFIPTKHAVKQGKSGFDGVNHYSVSHRRSTYCQALN